MAFWFSVVILSIVALGLYELYFWYKDKKNPLHEEIAAEEEAVEAVHGSNLDLGRGRPSPRHEQWVQLPCRVARGGLPGRRGEEECPWPRHDGPRSCSRSEKR